MDSTLFDLIPVSALIEQLLDESRLYESVGMRAYFAELTEEVAALLLENNTNNRPLKRGWVERLAAVIRKGEWQLNGESIVVSDTGKLLQGQHRCHAVVQTGISIPTLVVVGVPEAAFTTFDQGKKRSTADVFSISGEVNAKLEATIARMLYIFDKTGNPTNTGETPSPTELLRVLQTNPDIRDAAHYAAGNKWCKKVIGTGLTGFCWLIFHRKDSAMASEFFELLSTGARLDASSPILLLRNRLTTDANANARMGTEYKAGLVFKTFRDFAQKKRGRRYLAIRTTGARKETNIFDLSCFDK